MITTSPQAAKSAWEHDSLVNSYTPDLASEIDSETEELADDFLFYIQNNIPKNKIPIDMLAMKEVCIAAGKWGLKIREEEKNNLSLEAWKMLGEFIMYIIMMKNVRASIYGFAFALGVDQLNGIKSQSEVAKSMGMTRASLSHYKRQAQDWLGVFITKFGRTAEAIETYKQEGGALKKISII